MSQRSSSRSNSSQTQQPPPPDPNKTVYTVAVKTSDVFGAGTDANVFVQLIGAKGTSPSTKLKTSINHRNKFERKHSDVFIFPDMQLVGELKQVKIWHDNTGIGAAWHLAEVEVHDASTNTIYKFPCNMWLSKKDGDGKLCRVLACTAKRQKIPKHIRIQQEMMQKQQQQQGQNPQEGQEGQSGQYPPQGQGQNPQQWQYPPQGPFPRQGQYPPWPAQGGINPQAQNQYQAIPRKRCDKEKTENVIVPKQAALLQYNGYGWGNPYGYPCYGGYNYGYPYFNYGYPYSYGVVGSGYGYPPCVMAYGGFSWSWSWG